MTHHRPPAPASATPDPGQCTPEDVRAAHDLMDRLTAMRTDQVTGLLDALMTLHPNLIGLRLEMDDPDHAAVRVVRAERLTGHRSDVHRATHRVGVEVRGL